MFARRKVYLASATKVKKREKKRGTSLRRKKRGRGEAPSAFRAAMASGLFSWIASDAAVRHREGKKSSRGEREERGSPRATGSAGSPGSFPSADLELTLAARVST